MSAITAKASRKMKKYAVLTREPRCFLGSFDFSWEQRKLGDIFKYEQPQAYIVESTEYDDRFQIPVLTAGQSFVLGYTDEDFGIKNANHRNPVVIFDDFTTSSHYVDFPFKVKSSAMKLLSLVNGKDDIHCAYNVLQNIGYEPVSHERHWISTFAKFNVYMPKNSTEQKCIGNYFANLDNLITLHQRKCALLFSPFQAFISMMFTTSTFSWEQRKLASLCEKFTDGDWIESKDQSDFGVRLVQTGNVGVAEYLDKTNNKKWISEDTFDRLHCEEVLPGDILISRLPEPAGRACIVPLLGTKMITAVDCTIVRTAPDMSNKFLVQYLSSQAYFDDVNTCLAGGTRQRISRGNLANFNVPIPVKKSEQDAIGMFFGYLDNLITLHQRKCIFFTGRAGRLISTVNKKRITSSWEQRKLSEITDKVTEKNAGLQYVETFTNSAEFGIISQRDFFDHDIAKLGSLDGYYIVKNEDFVYNPRISTSAPVGPINRNKLGRTGVMSPLYTVFRPHDIDTTYLEYFFKCGYWHSFMNFNGDSGARSDRFSIRDNVFFQMPIPIPDIDEQRKIGELLTCLDNLITLHQRKPFLMKWRTSDANRNQTNRLVL